MTTKRWISVFLIIAVICSILIVLPIYSSHGSVVTISQDGTVLYTIDLSSVQESYDLTIPYGDHYNIIRVAPNAISVREADCSNQVCVNHGVLKENGAPITCLPHRLIISWAESQVDA